METPLTVTQLNTRVRGLLQSTPGVRDIWVSGEISNLKRYSSGHYYFTLKDEGSEIRSVMFAGRRARIDFEPADNMKVVAFGSVDLYVQRGSYQFIVESMRKSGLGDLYLRFEELKKRLEAEGLFAPEHKRPLPRYPRTIGVVTSETGAVIHDIITTSATRFPADILLAPAQVQGDGAAKTIVAGIRLLNSIGVDVIIVGRGGGSLEDLWPFNEEMVARAIYNSEVPVVSAVGHETDFTIADFVADARAPTPTGAAALILRDKAEIRDQLDRDMYNADRALKAVLERMRGRFDLADSRLSLESAVRDLDMRAMDVDRLWSDADRALNDVIRRMRDRLAAAESRLSPDRAMLAIRTEESRIDRMDSVLRRSAEDSLSRASMRLSEASARLEAMDPLKVLDRGYGMVTDGTGRAVTDISSLAVGEAVGITLRGGSADATIRSIRRNQRWQIWRSTGRRSPR